jgi:hypothetical protein
VESTTEFKAPIAVDDEPSLVRQSASPDQASLTTMTRLSGREGHLAQKLERARHWLERVEPRLGDSRDALLRIAVFRRDEALLDGLLAALEK